MKQLTPPFLDFSKMPPQPDPFTDQVARVASILHDAFDGRPNNPAADVPGNGAAWILNIGLPAPQQFMAPPSPFTTSLGFFRVIGSLNDTIEPPAPAVIHEESIAVPGAAFPKVLVEWLRRESPPPFAALRQDTFLRGLTQVMLDSGGGSSEICRLYDLHQGNDVCPAWGPTGAAAAPPPPFYFCAPNSILIKGQCIDISPPEFD